MTLAIFDEKVDPSFVPVGNNSHAKVNVALGLLTESNYIGDSPLIRGTAVIK